MPAIHHPIAAFIISALLASAGISQIPEKERSGTFVLEWRKTDSDADYHRATASFEYATRLDAKRTLNDWDLCLQGSGEKRRPYSLVVRTVTDDRSDFWDLGAVKLEKVTKKSVKKRGLKSPVYDGTAAGAGLPPVVGHVYVVHTKDSDSDFWARFRVKAVVPRTSVTIEWELLSTPQRKVDADREKRTREARERKGRETDLKRDERKKKDKRNKKD